MAQSENKTKIMQFDIVGVLLTVVLLGVVAFMGVKNNKESKANEKLAADMAVLANNIQEKDSVIVVLQERNKVLEAKVVESDKSMATLTSDLSVYKKKYREVLAIEPSPCDTFVKFVECDNMVEIYENYLDAMKLNVITRQNLIDTLKVENKELALSNTLQKSMSEKYEAAYREASKKLKRSRVGNVIMGTAVATTTVLLFIF